MSKKEKTDLCGMKGTAVRVFTQLSQGLLIWQGKTKQ